MTTNFDPKYVEVCLPITVPLGVYCWRYGGINTPICDYFDNTGGHSRCLLEMEVIDSVEGVLKGEKCRMLKQ